MGNRHAQDSTGFADSAYRTYGRELRRYLLRRLRNRQDARELAQEVWTRLLRVENPERVLEPLAYIYRAAANVLAEFYMRQKREPVDFDSDAMSQAGENLTNASSDDSFERLATQRQVQRILIKLPQTYRRILLMRLCDGMSYADIGRELKLSPQTTEKYFFRAMSAARAAKWD